MNKFRNWCFRLLTGGYTIIDYKELLDTAIKTLEYAEKVNENSGDVLKLTKEVNERCEMLIKRCKELEAIDSMTVRPRRIIEKNGWKEND